MNILKIVHNYYPENSAGVEVYVHELACNLSAGNRVALFTRGKDIKAPVFEEGETYSIFKVPLNVKNGQALKFFRQCMEVFRPDVVHIHHLHGLGLEIPLFLIQQRLPYVITLHDYWFLCPRIRMIDREGRLCSHMVEGCPECMYPNRFIKRLRMRAAIRSRMRDAMRVLNSASFVMTPSTTIKKRFVECGVKNERFMVERLGVALSRGARRGETKESGELTIGFVGTISEFKGADLLIRAVRAMSLPNRLYLYGEIYKQDRRLFEDALRMDGKVVYRGKFDHKDLHACFDEIDILVVPSLCEEAHCLVIDEARMKGIPVIASAVGAIPERIVDGVNGFLVTPGDAGELTEKITWLIKNYNTAVEKMDMTHNLRSIQEDADAYMKMYESATMAVPTTDESREIRTLGVKRCLLCGEEGTVIHRNMRDRIFNCGGVWSFRKCPSRSCGLMWLDPFPDRQDLYKIYREYYTHIKNNSFRPPWKSFLASFLRWSIRRVFSLLSRAIALRKNRKLIDRMYLEKEMRGKLLEVGCGDGSRLARLREQGWDVVGQEIDPQAAESARQRYGLRVHVGELGELSFPDGHFNVVIMNHVIEHVYDPVGIMKECHRILKDGGVFVATTPNIESYGYKVFGPDWFGLDPPRHLYLFSRETLKRVAEQAGFESPMIWTSPSRAQSFATGSFDIKFSGSHRMGERAPLKTEIYAMLFQIWAWLVFLFQPDSGEECIVKAVKKG